jgi:hypothetical protein
MASSGVLRHVALLRTDVSEDLSPSIIRVTRIGELGTLAVIFTGQDKFVRILNLFRTIVLLSLLRKVSFYPRVENLRYPLYGKWGGTQSLTLEPVKKSTTVHCPEWNPGSTEFMKIYSVRF